MNELKKFSFINKKSKMKLTQLELHGTTLITLSPQRLFCDWTEESREGALKCCSVFNSKNFACNRKFAIQRC